MKITAMKFVHIYGECDCFLGGRSPRAGIALHRTVRFEDLREQKEE